jgi:hypothetical protein
MQGPADAGARRRGGEGARHISVSFTRLSSRIVFSAKQASRFLRTDAEMTSWTSSGRSSQRAMSGSACFKAVLRLRRAPWYSCRDTLVVARVCVGTRGAALLRA